MSSIISPNMSLIIPTVGVEIGPDYAFDVNNSLTLIDNHDHSPGKGLPVTPSGLNINADLDFNGNSALNILNLVFDSQATATSILQALSVAPGSETPNAIQDLWYTDSMGNKIQITEGGQLASVPTSVSGITYAAGTFAFRRTPDSLPTTPANLDAGSITIRPNIAGTAAGVTLTPTSNTLAYNIGLPLLPAANSFLYIDNSGNMSATLPVSASNGLFLRQQSSAATWASSLSGIVSKTTTYSATISDDVILCSGSTFTVTLYTAVGNTGRELIIRKTDATLANVITVATTGGQLLLGYSAQGTTSTALHTQYEAIRIVSDGTNWNILERYGTKTLPVAYTPTTAGLGTTSSRIIFSWRDGNHLCFQTSWTNGTVDGSTASFTIGFNGVNTPSGLNISTTLINAAYNCPVGTWGNTPTKGGGPILATGGNTISLFFGSFIDSAGSGQPSATIQTGGTLGTGSQITAQVRVPIANWNQ